MQLESLVDVLSDSMGIFWKEAFLINGNVLLIVMQRFSLNRGWCIKCSPSEKSTRIAIIKNDHLLSVFSVSTAYSVCKRN